MKNGFYSNVLRVFVGSAGSQIVWVSVMVAVSRLYTPDDLGEYQLFISAASIMAIVACGRYDFAVALPKYEYQAAQLFFFAVSLSFVVAGIFLGMIVVGRFVVVELAKIPVVYVFLLSFYVIELCLYMFFYAWMIRKKKYTVASKGIVLFPLSYFAWLLLFYTISVSMQKLILAVILARSTVIVYYGRHLYEEMKRYRGKFSKRGVWKKGIEYIDFPKYMLFGNFLDTAMGHIIPFFVTAFWGTAATGYYSMAMQCLSAPSSLVAKAVGDVFRQEGSRIYMKFHSCMEFYKKNIYLCMAYSFCICCGMYLLISPILNVFFGPQWSIAGDYVRWMLPMTAFVLVASPLSHIYIIARRQKQYLVIQGMAFIGSCLGVGVLGWYGCSIGEALTTWGILSMGVSMASLCGGARIAQGK